MNWRTMTLEAFTAALTTLHRDSAWPDLAPAALPSYTQFFLRGTPPDAEERLEAHMELELLTFKQLHHGEVYGVEMDTLELKALAFAAFPGHPDFVGEYLKQGTWGVVLRSGGNVLLYSAAAPDVRIRATFPAGSMMEHASFTYVPVDLGALYP
jgi:hypothetical protein